MSGALFVVSTGRTGTQFLADLFGRLGARASHEPGPRWLRLASNAHASGHLSTERAGRLLERVRGDDLADPTARAWVESSCLVYGLVEPLLRTFPDASVVQVVRDPRTYVRSGLGWGAYRKGGRVLNLVPFRRLAPPQFDAWSPRARLDWARRGQFERLCWAWTGMNRAMRTQGTERAFERGGVEAAGADRFSVVRFEDLFDPERSGATLRGLCARAGVEADGELLDSAAERRVNAGRKPETPDWSRWTPEERRTLVETCGDEAARYGYRLDAADDEVAVTP